MEATTTPRVFEWKGMRLSDPNPNLPLEGVKGVLALEYPEIGNAQIKGPEETAEASVYKVEASYGRKG